MLFNSGSKQRCSGRMSACKAELVLPKSGWLTPKSGQLTPKSGWLTPKSGWLTPKSGWLTPMTWGGGFCSSQLHFTHHSILLSSLFIYSGPILMLLSTTDMSSSLHFLVTDAGDQYQICSQGHHCIRLTQVHAMGLLLMCSTACSNVCSTSWSGHNVIIVIIIHSVFVLLHLFMLILIPITLATY